MTYDSYGVRVTSSAVPYEDGSEDTVLSELLNAPDRSDGSDELSMRIVDWSTRYHFSPLRTNLLRPLRVAPELRVLDLGCGTGSITRWLGEQGANVVGLEGNVARARAAAVRCQDLSNVEIVAGTLESLPDDRRFDLVVVVGVLEYSPTVDPAEDAPTRFLRSVRERLEGSGAIVLAIENQLGLKYLLGYSEDHHGLPWLGVEGYERGGARTWSRRQLLELLREAGFPEQRWLYPFPDYKLPSLIIDEQLYGLPEASHVIDHLLRTPVTGPGPPSLVCDARRAHRQLLDAGLGPDVANSFLVIASRDQETPKNIVGPELAWFYTSSRRRQWRRERLVGMDLDGLHMRDTSDPTSYRTLSWLSQRVDPGGKRPFLPGEPLDLLLTTALRRRDMSRIGELLRLWRNEVEADGKPEDQPLDAHPFAPLGEGDLALPPEFLDVIPSNFILHEGQLAFIDSEWVASSPVSARLVELRGLWWFASGLVETGDHHPWGSLASVEEVCASLCGLVGLPVSGALLERWRQAEVELQYLVHGHDRDGIKHNLETMSSRRTADVSPRLLPFTELRAQIETVRHDSEQLASALADAESRAESHERLAEQRQGLVDELQARTEALLARIQELETQLQSASTALDRATAQGSALDQQRAEAEAHAAHLEEKMQQLEEELQRWTQRFEAMERRLPVRLYRYLRRLGGR